VRLHRRQFVLGPEPVAAAGNWVSRELAPGRWLSHCPELRVGVAADASGAAWALLGLAVQTNEDAPDPLEQIAAAATEEVPGLYGDWAGRWALIGGGGVHLDAAGLLGCFYTAGPEDELWVSSSPALLMPRARSGTRGQADDRSLAYEVGISWVVPPLSRFGGMRKVLPSQLLRFDGGLERRPLLAGIEPGLGADRAIELLGRSLVTAFRRLSLTGAGPWLSLSAGADSRVALAAAHRAGVEPRPFTRVTPRVPFGDRALPPKLAAALGYRHSYLRARRPKPGRTELVEEHSAGHVSRGDAEPVILGVRDALDGISAGGECFPVANRACDGARIPPAALADPERCLEALAAAYGEASGSAAVGGLRRWLEWSWSDRDRIDLRDRFCIEQHLAGWQSAKEQVYDLLPVERFFALNSARSYALLLGLDESLREGATLHTRLIDMLAPELMEEPFNPPERAFGLLRTTVVRSRDDPLYPVRRLARRVRRARGGSGVHP
jgi:hypothetical protein